MAQNLIVVAEARSGKVKRPSLEAVCAGKSRAADAGCEVFRHLLGLEAQGVSADLVQTAAGEEGGLVHVGGDSPPGGSHLLEAHRIAQR